MQRTHVVIIAMWTELVALIVVGHVFAECLFAFLAEEVHLHRLLQLVVLRLRVTFGAVEPLFATWSADGDLRVQDVFAGMYGDIVCLDE